MITWVVVRKVFISSSIDRPLANNFLDIRQISEKSGYLSLMMLICWWANFLTRRQSFRQIILCPPHCGIRGNSRLSHGVGSDLEAYDFSDFQEGVTTRQEMQVSLRLKNGRISSAPGPLYVGLASISLENRKDMGSVYERVAFNMQELTYRVHFTISSIGSPFPIDEEFIIRIEDDNGVYDFNGRIALCERFEYATEAIHDAEGALKADFTLMKLEEGRNAFVSLIDKTTGEILYTANLVDDILMFRGDAGEPPYSLECDHDFPITLKLKYEKETWMLIQATVLDWNVVSRPIELEN